MSLISIGEIFAWCVNICLSSCSDGHSTIICLTVSSTRQSGQNGLFSFFRMYSWVNLVCPMRSLAKLRSQALELWNDELNGPILCLMFRSLFVFWLVFVHSVCHWFLTLVLKAAFMSFCGRLMFVIVSIVIASFANLSAISLLWNPLCDGTQHIVRSIDDC